MKILVITVALFSFSLVAKEPVKKNIELKGFVSKLKPSKGHFYWFSMHESSTPYYADEKFVPCLEKSMTDNKVANITISPSSIVLKCSMAK
ncbi:MAG: hypothetical protein H7336_02445 [Bacteriovorax sp.]|nr:hypothetical protein [Bacteriovorax sp.]